MNWQAADSLANWKLLYQGGAAAFAVNAAEYEYDYLCCLRFFFFVRRFSSWLVSFASRVIMSTPLAKDDKGKVVVETNALVSIPHAMSSCVILWSSNLPFSSSRYLSASFPNIYIVTHVFPCLYTFHFHRIFDGLLDLIHPFQIQYIHYLHPNDMHYFMYQVILV